jgi:Protein of unknown function (DUF3307)
MDWSSVLMALLVSHVTGDVLLQTDWQALNKGRGADDAVARRALAGHLAAYTAAFVPALVWIGRTRGIGRSLSVGGVVVGSHLVIDEGRVAGAWARRVKRSPKPPLALLIAVDQGFHTLSLLAAALVATT